MYKNDKWSEQMIVNGTYIRERRLALGISQTDLAEGICHQSMISRLETSNHITSMTILQQLCIRLQIAVIDIVAVSEFNYQPLALIRNMIDQQDLNAAEKHLSNQNLVRRLPKTAMPEHCLLSARVKIARNKFSEAVGLLQRALLEVDGNRRIMKLEIETELCRVWLLMGEKENAQELMRAFLRTIRTLKADEKQIGSNELAVAYFRAAQLKMAQKSFVEAKRYLARSSSRKLMQINMQFTVEVQLLRARLSELLENSYEFKEALSLASAAAEFSRNPVLQDTVKDYMAQKNDPKKGR
jgi:transcriptional regulator with XRE-family HTH domain